MNTFLRYILMILILLNVVACGVNVCRADDNTWTRPEVKLPENPVHPLIALTPVELERLRTAFTNETPDHAPVAGVVRSADAALNRKVVFPPRGGQHNKWYQCDKCQTGLVKTKDGKHKCPVCGRIYEGQVYNDATYKGEHGRILNEMLVSAKAYAVTGESKYAEHAAEILLGYSDRYMKYPFHGSGKNPVWNAVAGGRLYEQTLSEASAMALQIAPAYDLIHDWSGLTKVDHERIRSGLIVPILENIDKYKAGRLNWQSWHNAAMFAGGAVIHEEAWMRKAAFGGESPSKLMRLYGALVNGNVQPDDDDVNGFLWQLRESVTSDGMWYEMSWGYHIYTLQALTCQAEAARRLGIDLWHVPGFKNMFVLPVACVMPDGTLPKIGDDVGTSIARKNRVFESAWAVYRDPVFLSVLRDRPTWESVMYGRDVSKTSAEAAMPNMAVFKETGLAILRSRTGEAGLAAFLVFGPYGGYHGHLDKLSFMLYGFGAELGIDAGRARSQAYRLPIHREWYKASISHNVVLVDDKSQLPAEGRFDFKFTNSFVSAVSACCTAAYPGVEQHRLLALSSGYLLVVDDVVSDKPHRYNWIYHNRGNSVGVPGLKSEPAVLENVSGAKYIKDLKEFKPSENIHVVFKGNKADVYLTCVADPATCVYTGNGPAASVTDRVPLAVVSAEGKNARFVAVLEPVKPGTAPMVKDVAVKEKDGMVIISVNAGKETDVFHLRPGKELMAERNTR